MDKKARNFRHYKVWQDAVTYASKVYQVTSEMPWFEKKGLCDQIRRAIVSVPSNLAEGSGRTSLKEQLHFYEISYGSLMETYNQLMIAADLKYIGEDMVYAPQP